MLRAHHSTVVTLQYFGVRALSTLMSRTIYVFSRSNAPLSPRQQIVMDVFNMFDTDGSGEIELDEIARAFKVTGKLTDETRAQLKAHFEFMDSDGSGKQACNSSQELLLCRGSINRPPFGGYFSSVVDLDHPHAQPEMTRPD